MTVLRLLELTKRLLPVATEIDDALLLMWLSNCENTILTDVLLASPENCKEIVEATDAPLLVPHPFDNFIQTAYGSLESYLTNRIEAETLAQKEGRAT